VIGDAEELYHRRLAELQGAIAKGQASRLKEIISRGAGINDRDEKGETPLMKAVQSGHIDVVRQLLDLGADYTVDNREHHDLFFHAIKIGRLEWLLTALDGGANLVVGPGRSLNWSQHVGVVMTITRENGPMVAAPHGQLSELKFMYQGQKTNGLNPLEALKHQDRDGKAALDHAQTKGHKEIVAWFQCNQSRTASRERQAAGGNHSHSPDSRKTRPPISVPAKVQGLKEHSDDHFFAPHSAASSTARMILS